MISRKLTRAIVSTMSRAVARSVLPNRGGVPAGAIVFNGSPVTFRGRYVNLGVTK